jgi:hypothetical protein
LYGIWSQDPCEVSFLATNPNSHTPDYAGMVTVASHDVKIETIDATKVNTYTATLTAYLVNYQTELAHKKIEQDFAFTLEPNCEYSPILQTTPV